MGAKCCSEERKPDMGFEWTRPIRRQGSLNVNSDNENESAIDNANTNTNTNTNTNQESKQSVEHVKVALTDKSGANANDNDNDNNNSNNNNNDDEEEKKNKDKDKDQDKDKDVAAKPSSALDKTNISVIGKEEEEKEADEADNDDDDDDDDDEEDENQSQVTVEPQSASSKETTAKLTSPKRTKPAKKRINSISWDAVQEKAFVRWANAHLYGRGIVLSSLTGSPIVGGVGLLNLISALSGAEMPKKSHSNPTTQVARLDNLTNALTLLEQTECKIVNIHAHDLEAGKLKLILGLFWTLILKFQVSKSISYDDDEEEENEGGGGGEADENKKKQDEGAEHQKKSVSGQGLKAKLLKWVNSKVQPHGFKVDNFTSSFADGRALAVLSGVPLPSSSSSSSGDALSLIEDALANALSSFGIPVLIDAYDIYGFANESGREERDAQSQSMITYVSYFRERERKAKAAARNKSADDNNKKNKNQSKDEEGEKKPLDSYLELITRGLAEARDLPLIDESSSSSSSSLADFVPVDRQQTNDREKADADNKADNKQKQDDNNEEKSASDSPSFLAVVQNVFGFGEKDENDDDFVDSANSNQGEKSYEKDARIAGVPFRISDDLFYSPSVPLSSSSSSLSLSASSSSSSSSSSSASALALTPTTVERLFESAMSEVKVTIVTAGGRYLQTTESGSISARVTNSPSSTLTVSTDSDVSIKYFRDIFLNYLACEEDGRVHMVPRKTNKCRWRLHRGKVISFESVFGTFLHVNVPSTPISSSTASSSSSSSSSSSVQYPLQLKCLPSRHSRSSLFQSVYPVVVVSLEKLGRSGRRAWQKRIFALNGARLAYWRPKTTKTKLDQKKEGKKITFNEELKSSCTVSLSFRSISSVYYAFDQPSMLSLTVRVNDRDDDDNETSTIVANSSSALSSSLSKRGTVKTVMVLRVSSSDGEDDAHAHADAEDAISIVRLLNQRGIKTMTSKETKI